ncbi:MAG: hypothetical protein CVV42_05710 [Candidatus Riflebacteria bacterium HGW-Riflebacteria-2]|nr:MAG: hypothetical protein CVV42_05710 [Candidatus Riflebacteria bacterium HGW-Riflebacteria-2]
MSKFYFEADEFFLENIHELLTGWLQKKNFEVEGRADGKIHYIKARKVGGWGSITGNNQAFKIRIYSELPNEFILDCTIGEWAAENAGTGVDNFFSRGINLVTDAVGSAMAIPMEKDICDFLEISMICKKKNNALSKSDESVSSEFETKDEDISKDCLLAKNTTDAFSSVLDKNFAKILKSKVRDTRFFLAPDIPAEKLEKSIEAFGAGIQKSQVIAFWDQATTAELNGIIFSEEFIAFKAGSEKWRAHVASLRQVKKDSGWLNTDILFNDSQTIFKIPLRNDSAEGIIDLIIAIAKNAGVSLKIDGTNFDMPDNFDAVLSNDPKEVSLRNSLRQLKERVVVPNFFVTPEIPEIDLLKAIKIYGNGMQLEEILVFYNQSSFLSGITGVIYSRDSIAANYGVPWKVAISEINEIREDKDRGFPGLVLNENYRLLCDDPDLRKEIKHFIFSLAEISGVTIVENMQKPPEISKPCEISTGSGKIDFRQAYNAGKSDTERLKMLSSTEDEKKILILREMANIQDCLEDYDLLCQIETMEESSNQEISSLARLIIENDREAYEKVHELWKKYYSSFKEYANQKKNFHVVPFLPESLKRAILAHGGGIMKKNVLAYLELDHYEIIFTEHLVTYCFDGSWRTLEFKNIRRIDEDAGWFSTDIIFNGDEKICGLDSDSACMIVDLIAFIMAPDLLKSVMGKIHRKHFFTGPRIPADALKKALNTYGKRINETDVLAFWRFDSCEAVFSKDSIAYQQSSWAGTGVECWQLNFSELAEISILVEKTSLSLCSYNEWVICLNEFMLKTDASSFQGITEIISCLSGIKTISFQAGLKNFLGSIELQTIPVGDNCDRNFDSVVFFDLKKEFEKLFKAKNDLIKILNSLLRSLRKKLAHQEELLRENYNFCEIAADLGYITVEQGLELIDSLNTPEKEGSIAVQFIQAGLLSQEHAAEVSAKVASRRNSDRERECLEEIANNLIVSQIKINSANFFIAGSNFPEATVSQILVECHAEDQMGKVLAFYGTDSYNSSGLVISFDAVLFSDKANKWRCNFSDMKAVTKDTGLIFSEIIFNNGEIRTGNILEIHAAPLLAFICSLKEKKAEFPNLGGLQKSVSNHSVEQAPVSSFDEVAEKQKVQKQFKETVEKLREDRTNGILSSEKFDDLVQEIADKIKRIAKSDMPGPEKYRKCMEIAMGEKENEIPLLFDEVSDLMPDNNAQMIEKKLQPPDNADKEYCEIIKTAKQQMTFFKDVFFVSSDFPEEVLNKALGTYGYGIERSETLAFLAPGLRRGILDISIGSAFDKSFGGIIFSVNSIATSSPQSGRFFYSDIKKIWKEIGRIVSTVVINDKQVIAEYSTPSSCIGNCSPETFLDGIINLIISLKKAWEKNPQPVKTKKEVACPKCQSSKISANAIGYSDKERISGAIAGSVLGFRNLFTIVGAIKDNEKARKVIITCLSCGHQWEPGLEWRSSISQ